MVVIVVLSGLPWVTPTYAHGDGLRPFAGTDHAGFSGDGGPALKAQLDGPTGVAVAPDGTVYIADFWSYRVRAVSPGGRITTIAGTGRRPDRDHPEVTDTMATKADIRPSALAVGPDGVLYIEDVASYQILAWHRDGHLTVVADMFGPNVHDRVESNRLFYWRSLATGPDGTVYVGDGYRCEIRAVTPAGAITTVAGGPTSRIPRVMPRELAVDRDGTVWFIDNIGINVLRRLSDGVITTVTAPLGILHGRWTTSTTTSDTASSVLHVSGLAAAPDGGVYVISQGNLLHLEESGRVSLIPTFILGGVVGGDITQIAATPDGELLFAAPNHHRVFALASRASPLVPPPPHQAEPAPSQPIHVPWTAIILVVMAAVAVSTLTYIWYARRD